MLQLMYRHRHDAYRVYLTTTLVTSFGLAMAFTINMVYLVRVLGLDPLQMVLVGTALELTAFLFEVPTGVVADVYSRRLSVILGMIFLGVSFIVFGLTTVFAVIILSQIIAGVGFTFISGAENAWLADEIGEEKASRAYLRGAQVGAIGGIVGIIVSVALALINLSLPIVLAGMVLMGLGIYVALFMPEAGFKPASREERVTFHTMTRQIQHSAGMVKKRPVLLTILGTVLIFGAFSEGFDRLWTLHILENFDLPTPGDLDSVVWFGLIGIVTSLIGMALTEFAHRRVNTNSHHAVARVLLAITSLLIVMVMVFALAGHFFLALAAFWAVGALRAVQYPLFLAWINQGLDSRVRATMISAASQVDALGQISGGPAIGLVGRVYGVRSALTTGALIISPAVVLFVRTLRRGDTTQLTDPQPAPAEAG